MAMAVFGFTGSALAAGMLKPGDAFPAWKLTDQAGKEVSSTELAGTTYLLYFFPKAMTPGCTKEGCALRDNYTGFEKAGVQILGVSFDAPATNAKFVEKEKFPFRLLSDTDKTLAVEVGAADSTQPALGAPDLLPGRAGREGAGGVPRREPGHARRPGAGGPREAPRRQVSRPWRLAAPVMTTDSAAVVGASLEAQGSACSLPDHHHATRGAADYLRGLKPAATARGYQRRPWTPPW